MRWTDPPRVTADVTGLLGQLVIAPWEPQPGRKQGRAMAYGPVGNRPVEAVAAYLASAAPGHDEGDGATPPDTGQDLRRFTETIAGAGPKRITARNSCELSR
jgi:hypothetical protein